MPSLITLVNNTDEMVCLALFMSPVLNPTLGTIAWRIAAPPPGGLERMVIPPDFAMQARYSDDPSNVRATTAPVAFKETTAAFSIDSITSQDGRATGAVIRQLFTDLVLNEVRVVNNYPTPVKASILKDGDPIYAPQVIWPGGLLMEDVRGAMQVAVVSQFTIGGQRLVQEELSLTRTEVREGDTLLVTGSRWKGYALRTL